MDKYKQLKTKPPRHEVKQNAREVVISILDVYGNKKKMTIKKDENGDFKIFSHGDAFSNFQIKFDIDEIEWEADDNNWYDVFMMINSGVCVVESVKSR